MPEKTPQLSEASLPEDTSDGGVEISTTPPRWRINKWKILAGVLAIFLFAAAVFAGYQPGQQGIFPKSSPKGEGEYQIFGSFTKEATDDALELLERAVSQYSPFPIAIMESFPPQFQIKTPDKQSCEEIRKVLSDFEFVGNFGECQKQEVPVNPEEPIEQPIS